MELLLNFASNFWLFGTISSVVTVVFALLFLVLSVEFRKANKKKQGKVFYYLWLVFIPLSSISFWLTIFSYILNLISFFSK